MLKDRRWVERAAETVSPEVFHDPVLRAIYQALMVDPELAEVPEGMDPQVALRLEALLADPEELSHAARVFEAATARLLDVPLEQEARELDRRIDEAATEDEGLRLLGEKARLRAEQRERHDPDWSSSRITRKRTQQSDRDKLEP
jgi:hypothetical protein